MPGTPSSCRTQCRWRARRCRPGEVLRVLVLDVTIATIVVVRDGRRQAIRSRMAVFRHIWLVDPEVRMTQALRIRFRQGQREERHTCCCPFLTCGGDASVQRDEFRRTDGLRAASPADRHLRLVRIARDRLGPDCRSSGGSRYARFCADRSRPSKQVIEYHDRPVPRNPRDPRRPGPPPGCAPSQVCRFRLRQESPSRSGSGAVPGSDRPVDEQRRSLPGRARSDLDLAARTQSMTVAAGQRASLPAVPLRPADAVFRPPGSPPSRGDDAARRRRAG